MSLSKKESDIVSILEIIQSISDPDLKNSLQAVISLYSLDLSPLCSKTLTAILISSRDIDNSMVNSFNNHSNFYDNDYSPIH